MKNQNGLLKKANGIRKWFLLSQLCLFILILFGGMLFSSPVIAEEEGIYCSKPGSLYPIKDIFKSGNVLNEECWFEKPLELIYKVADKVGQISFDALVVNTPFLPTILGLGFAFWLAFQVMKYVSTFYAQDPGDFFTHFAKGLFKFIVAFFLLTYKLSDGNTIADGLFNYFIGVFLSSSADLGKKMIMGNVEEFCNEAKRILASSCSYEEPPIPDGTSGAMLVYYSIVGLIRAIAFKFRLASAYGQTMIINGFNDFGVGPFSLCIPDIGNIFTGVAMYLMSLFFLFLIPLKLIEMSFRIAILYALLPVFIVAWAFPITRKYTKTAWNMVMYLVTFILMFTVLCCIAAALVTGGLSNEAGLTKLEIAGGHVTGKRVVEIFDGTAGGFLVFVLGTFVAVKAFGSTQKLAEFISGGSSMGMGDDGVSKAFASVASKAGQAGLGALMAVGGSISSGIKNRSAIRKNTAAGVMQRATSGGNSYGGAGGNGGGGGASSAPDANAQAGAAVAAAMAGMSDVSSNNGGGNNTQAQNAYGSGNTAGGDPGRKKMGDTIAGDNDNASRIKEGQNKNNVSKDKMRDNLAARKKDNEEKERERDALKDAAALTAQKIRDAQDYSNQNIRACVGAAALQNRNQENAFADAIAKTAERDALKEKKKALFKAPLKNRKEIRENDRQMRDLRRKAAEDLKIASGGDKEVKRNMKTLLGAAKDNEAVRTELDNYTSVTERSRESDLAAEKMREIKSGAAVINGHTYVDDAHREAADNLNKSVAGMQETLGKEVTEKEALSTLSLWMETVNAEHKLVNLEDKGGEEASKLQEIINNNKQEMQDKGISYENFSELVNGEETGEKIRAFCEAKDNIVDLTEPLSAAPAAETMNEAMAGAATEAIAEAAMGADNNKNLTQSEYWDKKHDVNVERKQEVDVSKDKAEKANKRREKLASQLAQAKSIHEALSKAYSDLEAKLKK